MTAVSKPAGEKRQFGARRERHVGKRREGKEREREAWGMYGWKVGR
jgi:hypothetical protein